MKIDKFIAQSGYTSRRKACVLVDEKRVVVNGKLANFTDEISDKDVIVIDGKKLIKKTFVPTYIVYNKPKGIVCTSEKVTDNIIDAVGHEETIYPVGRLDKDSEGLILLTNHGEIIDKISHASFGHEKEYIVTLNLPVRRQFIKEISLGVDLHNEKTKPCVVTIEPNAKRIFRIVLTQGLNRQIRRMCTKFDYQVIKLQRVRVMNVKLGKLKLGQWRNLTEDELAQLFEAIKK